MKNKSIILQIFNGERGHDGDFKASEEYKKNMDKFIEYENELLAKLSGLPEIKKLYKNITDIDDMMRIEEADAYYLEGFRLGALVGIDIMTPPDN